MTVNVTSLVLRQYFGFVSIVAVVDDNVVVTVIITICLPCVYVYITYRIRLRERIH